jgi:hypothetical protein
MFNINGESNRERAGLCPEQHVFAFTTEQVLNPEEEGLCGGMGIKEILADQDALESDDMLAVLEVHE